MCNLGFETKMEQPFKTRFKQKVKGLSYKVFHHLQYKVYHMMADQGLKKLRTKMSLSKTEKLALTIILKYWLFQQNMIECLFLKYPLF